LDRAQAALAQLRSELDAIHREALEVRLATGELWLQLSGTAPPAALTRSLGQVRARLAEHYRVAGIELVRQKDELDRIRVELGSQHEKLVKQRREFDLWAERRQQELDEQAARLVSREQEIEHQEAEFHDASRQWQLEELRYQQEVRRLRTQVEDAEAVLAPA